MKNNEQCNNVRELLSLYIDHMLSEQEKNDVELHLKQCPTCKQEYQELLEITELLHDVPEVPIPDQFEFRLKKALAEEGKQIRKEIKEIENNKEEKTNKKIRWRMISTIAAVFAISVISYASFDDVTIIPAHFLNGGNSQVSEDNYGQRSDSSNKDKKALLKDSMVQGKKDNTLIGRLKDNPLQEANNKEVLTKSQSDKANIKANTKDLMEAKSTAPKDLNSLQSTTKSKSKSIPQLPNPTNEADVVDESATIQENYFTTEENHMTTKSITINNCDTKEYYEKLIAKKLDGARYEIKSSKYENEEWRFVVFIFEGKSGNIVNKEIEVVGKGGEIQVLYADEFMGL